MDKKIYFRNFIDKQKNHHVKEWLNNFFNKKNFLIRICLWSFTLIVFSIIFFVLRANALKGWYGEPIFNTGSAFGISSNMPIWVNYFIKIIVSLIFLFLAILFNNFYINTCFWIVFINSMFNVIDKGLVDYYGGEPRFNAVVDYFDWKTFKNNIADIFIIAFTIASVAAILIDFLLSYLKNKKQEIKEGVEDSNVI